MVCPLDDKGIQELQETTGLKIRAVLCSRTAVFGGLEKYYSRSGKEASIEFVAEEEPPDPDSAAKLGTVAKITEQIEELPTLPDILNRISAVISDPQSSAKDLANVVATDSALTGKILRLANSPAYGFSRRIMSIGDAIAMIGFRETQELAISVSVFDQLGFRSGFDFQWYWKHSLECATLARFISSNLKPGGLESAFISGLLHDMGKVILAQEPLGGELQASLPYSASDKMRLKLEETAYGINHAEAGFILAEHWLLPDIVADAIRYHHAPELASKPSVPTRIVCLANVFCKMDPEQAEDGSAFDDGVRESLAVLEMSEAALRTALKRYHETSSELPPP
jgi:HD-like signal output (HDOD) protein